MAIPDSSLAQIYDAYRRLSHAQLGLFLQLRSLPIAGTDDELALRLAHYDIRTYHVPLIPNGQAVNGGTVPVPIKPRPHQPKYLHLPTEILAEIMDHVGDWELAKAVGVPTSLSQPASWAHANQCDHAILTGYLPLVRAADPVSNPPTKLSASLAVRFGYVNVLEYLLTYHRPLFRSLYKDDLLPISASRHGRVSVLRWWNHVRGLYPDVLPAPKSSSIAEAVEGACRNGQVASLDWWLFHSGIPLEYSDTALEVASAKNRIEILDWWKKQSTEGRLIPKIGRVMDTASTAGHVEVLEWWARSQFEFKYDRQALYHASCHGKTAVLQWWLTSGLQLIFDPDVLTGATRHNRPEVLSWWDQSGLPIQYRMCDIEEALEDAIGGGEAAREWWRNKGVDFNANDKEWMKLQNLN